MPDASPHILWLRSTRDDPSSRRHTQALLLSEDGGTEPIDTADGTPHRLPWEKLDVLLIDHAIPWLERMRLLLARRRRAPGCLVVLLVAGDARPPRIRTLGLVDHAFIEAASGQPAPQDSHRHTLLAAGSLDDPASLAKKARELLAAEHRTVLWIDPNITLASPAMRHHLHAVATLRQQGWTIRAWGTTCEAAPQDVEFVKLPTFPALPGPLIVLHLYSFRPIAQAAYDLHCLVKGRRPAAIVHSVYLETPDIASIHFHVGEWLRISRDLGLLDYRERLRRPLNLMTRRGERRKFTNPGIARFWPVSHSIAQLLVADGTPPEKIHVLSNSYDASRFNPENRQTMRGPARAELDFTDATTVLAFAGFGNFGRKGLWLAVDAIVDLAGRPGHGNTRLLVIGGRPAALDKVRAQIVARHGREALDLFSFTGTTDRPEYYFAACDGFLFPSYFEACALVGIETSVMGIPLFVTPHHGHEMYLAPGQNGELIEWDAGAIADALARHIEAGLDRYHRVVGEVWSREQYAQEMTRRYEALLGEREGS